MIPVQCDLFAGGARPCRCCGLVKCIDEFAKNCGWRRHTCNGCRATEKRESYRITPVSSLVVMERRHWSPPESAMRRRA